jgi:hypothetical protein
MVAEVSELPTLSSKQSQRPPSNDMSERIGAADLNRCAGARQFTRVR